MRILMVLSYYYPYISGLSEYVRRLSTELVSNGHKITVLTSQHDKKLPKKETIGGVEVIRCGCLFKLGKGIAMPSFVLKAYSLSKKHDIVNIHLPLIEAGILQMLVPKAIVTYHCDLSLGKGVISKSVEKIYYLSAGYSLGKAPTIITYTEDYASNSRLLKKYPQKCRYILPVVDPKHFRKKTKERMRKKYNLEGRKIVGFAGRFVIEKGIAYLIKSIPYVAKKHPNVKYVLAGEYSSIAGGSVLNEISKLVDEHKGSILLAGNISYNDLPEFYSMCDVLVLPSIDPLEAFGIVQVESFYCGTPVVATDLPGVRIPILETGMGIITKQRDELETAKAILKILSNRNKYIRNKKFISGKFSIKKIVKSYESICNEK